MKDMVRLMEHMALLMEDIVLLSEDVALLMDDIALLMECIYCFFDGIFDIPSRDLHHSTCLEIGKKGSFWCIHTSRF